MLVLRLRDGGVLIQRFQLNNNAGSGYIVAGTEPVALTSTVQTGTTTSVVVLPGTASSCRWILQQLVD
jgi:hypothetical protein